MDSDQKHTFLVKVEGDCTIIVKTDHGNDSFTCKNEYKECNFSNTSFISITGNVGNNPCWIEAFIDGNKIYREKWAVASLIEKFIDENTPESIQEHDIDPSDNPDL